MTPVMINRMAQKVTNLKGQAIESSGWRKLTVATIIKPYYKDISDLIHDS